MSLSGMAARRLLMRSGMRVSPFGISSTRSVIAPAMRNMVARRGFMFSVRLASPTAAAKPKPKPKATSTKAKAATTTAAKKSATITKAKKTTTIKAATKRKPAAKKAAPEKKAAPKVEKPPTPRNDPSLRAPPQRISPLTMFVKRMYPTLTPKPESSPAGMKQLVTMWRGMTDEEKKPFHDEAAAESAKRRKIYNKWRANLTPSEVRIINEYRTKKGAHRKLGTISDPAKKKPAQGYIKFYSEAMRDGRIDLSKAPTGTSPVVYATMQASTMWKGMTDAQKAAYKL